MGGLKYRIYEERINILDSYLISKNDFQKSLEQIKEMSPSHKVWNRTLKSLLREWAVHNFLYNLGVLRKKTKDVSLDYPQTRATRFCYWLLGGIAKLLIK